MNVRPVLIMAGGTGGHVYPALAVAAALQRASRPVVWLGTEQGLEARVVPDAGIDIEWLSIRGLRGKGLAGWLAAPWRVSRAIAQALAVIRRRDPVAVLGMGGFVAGPGGIAAWLARRPLIIHEQNAIAGLTNRLLARFARVVLEAFPGSFSLRIDAQLVGNPVRESIAALPAPAARIAAHDGPLRVLVLGGSLGARSLNEHVPAGLGLAAVSQALAVRHQTGRGSIDAVAAAYREAKVDADVLSFIDDMAAAYRWADCVICRGGALTVAELTAAGLPAVIVPYPFAVDDHQRANAAQFVEVGAGLVLDDAALAAATVFAALTELGTERDALARRAEAARSIAAPDATATIAGHCLNLAEAQS
ncbi:MAG: undecaprenyldiphospho-muramoylpentapeptide beta-N-acetylglucosaminyltransferase [Pseudomonadota bacterium]